MTKFLFQLHKSTLPCSAQHERYFTQHSFRVHYLGKVFLDKYGVCAILDNDLDGLESRLFYIQDREPCSLFLGLL